MGITTYLALCICYHASMTSYFHVLVKILKALLPSSILATCPAHLNLLDLITLTILGERYKLCGSIYCSLFYKIIQYVNTKN